MSNNPIVVTLKLTASDAAKFQEFLSEILPKTRQAEGCRSSKTYLSQDSANELILIQEWDSLANQQAYMKWRESTGVLEKFLGFLAKPPEVTIWNQVVA